ncbi:class I SAM-dependent methyltransferase [Kordiimonas sp.]|uniref:class I SAM-dependent methyltransferase n=1 Tax=Kordiimonas sp. TaxID=1970157 RepID=UPI003A8D088A
MDAIEVTNDWFVQSARPVWDKLIPSLKPEKILEVGSFEGASACYLISSLASEHALEIHCVDTWEGGVEHESEQMGLVEDRFRRNTQSVIDAAAQPVDLVVHKGSSDMEMASLLAGGKKNYFDFVYIDGSHQAPDVLCDAVLGFKLLKVGGIMAFDDYLWSEMPPPKLDALRSPKLAIDAFVNTHLNKLKLIRTHLHQLYIRKLSN